MIFEETQVSDAGVIMNECRHMFGLWIFPFSCEIFQLLFAQSSLDCKSTKADTDENKGIIPNVNERKFIRSHNSYSSAGLLAVTLAEKDTENDVRI